MHLLFLVCAACLFFALGFGAFMPDFVKSVSQSGKSAAQRVVHDSPNYGTYFALTAAVMSFALLPFALFKGGGVLIAYLFSDDLLEFFRMLRGVYSFTRPEQSPLTPLHLLAGTLAHAGLQCLAVYMGLTAIGRFMTSLNRYRDHTTFREKDLFYFGLVAMTGYVFLDVLFYGQSFDRRGTFVHFINLLFTELPVLLFYFALYHVRLLNKPNYQVSLGEYLNMSPFEVRLFGSAGKLLWVTFFLAVLFSLPFHLGTQFLTSDPMVVVCTVLFVGLASLLLRAYLRRGFNYLAEVMVRKQLAETQLESFAGVTSSTDWTWTLILVGALMAVGCSDVALLLLPMLVILLLGGSGLVLLYSVYAFGNLLNFVFHRFGNSLSVSFSFFDSISFFRSIALSACVSLYAPFVFLFTVFALLAVFPKPFSYENDALTSSLFDTDGNILYTDKQVEYASAPVTFTDLPPAMVRALLRQEDANALRQNDWWPNLTNYHGLSAAMAYRYVKSGGGGSNVNAQLIKNLAFRNGAPVDGQRKLAEAFSSFQLSLQLLPQHIVTHYFNTVPFNGGAGHTGIAHASLAAFGRSPGELNELEAMYLIGTLPRKRSMRVANGYVAYKDAPNRIPEIRAALLQKASHYVAEGKLSLLEYENLLKLPLRFTFSPAAEPLTRSTNDFVRKQLPAITAFPARYSSSLSLSGQAIVQKTVAAFEQDMSMWSEERTHDLYSAALIVKLKTGKIIAHHGGFGGVDLTTLGTGNPVGSTIKPFVLLELLERGIPYSNVRLYDGRIGDRSVPQNYSRRYSNKFVGPDYILKFSPNAPMANIYQITSPIPLFKSVENKFSRMNICKDPYLGLSDSDRADEHIGNYPIGSRNMRLYDLTQAYQTLLNQGVYRKLSILEDVTNGKDFENRTLNSLPEKIYRPANAVKIKKALRGAAQPGGTTNALRTLLPPGVYYSKTGTSEGAVHGYTVLSDGDVLVVTWVSYCRVRSGQLICNEAIPIPQESGGRSAGILAAQLYSGFK